MTFLRPGALRLPLLGAALFVLAGCAAPQATDWNLVSARDQHRLMPTTIPDLRPAVIVTTGPTGLMVGTAPDAPAPAVQVVSQDGRLRLVSRETLATMQAQPPTGAMGAAPR